ncbi:LAS seventeen-binding protein 5 [Spathaspora sp. JA1]|nr:LAS seventeen-binding protein 5 [Spathaspora sp. JA1]
MPLFSDHAYTSITIKINQLASHTNTDYEEDQLELSISDVIELIKIQPSTGATEAARAIRKKIKYGEGVQEQIRALNILELLVLNAGTGIGKVLARDDKLLDVLQGIIRGSGKTGDGTAYHKKVRSKVVNMARGWKDEFADMGDEFKYLQGLYKTIPGGKSKRREREQGDDEEEEGTPRNYFDDEPEESTERYTPPVTPRQKPKSRRRRTESSPPPRDPSPVGSTSRTKEKKSKKSKKKNGIVYADQQFEIPQINYKVEAPKIRDLLATSYTHSTTLSNLLLQLPQGETPLDNDKCLDEFQSCKKLRRKILHYLQYVGAGSSSNKSSEVAALDEEFLGSLINANEQLVEVFKKFDVKAGYTHNNVPTYGEEEESDSSYYTDSDSEEEDSIEDRLKNINLQNKSPPPPPPPSKLKSPPPPRPNKPKVLSVADDNNPFGDGNAVGDSIYD